MELTKWLTSVSSTRGKRFALALLSLAGVIAYSAFNGTPLDVNSVSSIAQVLLTTAGAFLAAHGSYSLLTGKTAPQQQPYFAQNRLRTGVWSPLP
jgi:hypothetical protein